MTSLHLYLSKYKMLYQNFDNLQDNVKQKIRIAILNFRHTDIDDSLFGKNLLIKQVNNDFLLIFWDDERICSYLVNEINIARLDFQKLDYTGLRFYPDFLGITENMITIAFKNKEDDFEGMVAPIVCTYVFDINNLSAGNIIVGLEKKWIE